MYQSIINYNCVHVKYDPLIWVVYWQKKSCVCVCVCVYVLCMRAYVRNNIIKLVLNLISYLQLSHESSVLSPRSVKRFPYNKFSSPSWRHEQVKSIYTFFLTLIEFCSDNPMMKTFIVLSNDEVILYFRFWLFFTDFV